MKKFNNAGFSIIEILVGIFIFTLGLLSVYLMLHSSVRMNDYSRHEIIAANLARESLDLVKNIRDTNFSEQTAWNLINPNNYLGDKFELETYYKIENNFDDSVFAVKTSKIDYFAEGKNEVNSKMKDYRLYLDDKDRYIYENNSINNKPTEFYKYIKIEKADYTDENGDLVEIDENEALRVISKVIWTTNGYHEVELRTIITNWKKL
ncbi:MAG: prepilin-type N-terminal cleavage/methylation domain-containing protein [Candidatus Gracilibacteria bacterium]|nr:prepilin-type N-terminal cleavage/methylation domain-containing protein [Candidatus Gracilibacteria bacterium]